MLDMTRQAGERSVAHNHSPLRMYKIRSFDVFDTCLLRSYSFPSDVFCEMAAGLSGKPKLSRLRISTEDFRSARIKAEATALSKTSAEDVTLQDIWYELALVLKMDDHGASGMEYELELERRQIRPNRNVLSIVQAARQSGSRIVFVSDTYLPQEFVRDVLNEHGFFAYGDGLFVSSEVGLKKQTGNLFRHMLWAEGVDATAVHHLGDSVVGDFRVPLSLEIDATLSTDAELDPTERAVLNASLNHTQITSKLAARSRIFRLSTAGPIQDDRSFVASFLGPFLLTFASWVLSAARQDGIRRLYFLARDGYLLSRAAMILAPQFEIETRYLHVSRQALLLPSSADVSETGLAWLKRSFDKPTIQRLLAKLDLENSVARDLLFHALGVKDDRYVLGENADWAKLWQVIGVPPVRQILENTISERRKQAVGYLRMQGLSDRIPWAIVDLGWRLTGQTALQALLGHTELARIRGYYLGLHIDRNSFSEAGGSTALFYDEPPDRASAIRTTSIFRRGLLLEHLLGLAPHGRTQHYESSGVEIMPVCASQPAPHQELARNIEVLVDEFTFANVDLAAGLQVPEVAREILDQLTYTCFGRPKREWIELLRRVTVSEDQNDVGAVPLVCPITWKRFAVNCIPRSIRRHLVSQANCPWAEASQIISSGAIRRATKLRTLAVELVRECTRGNIQQPYVRSRLSLGPLGPAR
jgi:FMN phosphatase YigB (HAD superfamily)